MVIGLCVCDRSVWSDGWLVGSFDHFSAKGTDKTVFGASCPMYGMLIDIYNAVQHIFTSDKPSNKERVLLHVGEVAVLPQLVFTDQFAIFYELLSDCMDTQGEEFSSRPTKV